MRTLYHTPLSPFCRKIRILLAEKGLTFELTQENFWERRLEFFALNPAGEVPVLLDLEDRAVSGHYAIMEYIEEMHPEPNFIGKSIGERAEVRRLISWFDNKFDYEVTQNMLFEKHFKRLMYGLTPNTEAIRVGTRNILYHLDYIGYLTENRKWLAGERISLADFAAAAHFSALDYFGDVPWEHNANAKQWYALVKSRPSIRAVLNDRISGYRPPEHYDNPDF